MPHYLVVHRLTFVSLLVNFLISESSRPNPLNSYGELKLAGEEATRTASEDHTIFRIPILFGQVEKLEESAVTVLLKVVLLNDDESPLIMFDIRLCVYFMAVIISL